MSMGVVGARRDPGPATHVQPPRCAQPGVDDILAVEIQIAVDVETGVRLQTMPPPVGSRRDLRRQAHDDGGLGRAFGGEDIVVMGRLHPQAGPQGEASGLQADGVIGGLRPLAHGDAPAPGEQVGRVVQGCAQRHARRLGGGVRGGEQGRGCGDEERTPHRRPHQPFSYCRHQATNFSSPTFSGTWG